MEYSLQKLEKSRVEAAISIEKEEWKAAIQEAYKKNKHHYKVEGFRPGKVPYSVLVARFGEELFYEDALDIALSKYYSEILSGEKDLEPVGRPDVDVKEVSEDGVKAVITFEVYPEVEVGQYKGLTIEKAKAEVSEDDVQKEIDKKLDEASRFIDVEGRAAAKGDKVIIDYSGSVDGVKFDGGTAEKQTLDLGSGMFIPGFEEQVEGMNKGDSKDIKVTFPKEYGAADLAGKEAVFAITLHEIKTKETPALDDDFAKDVSEFDTLDDYKASIRATLQKVADERARYQEDDKLIDTITENTEVEIPDALIAEELERMIDDLKMRMSYSGLKFEDYLKYSGTTEDDIRAERREVATKNVKTRLVIEGIIKKEKLEISKEEMDAEVAKMASEANKSVEDFQKGLNQYDFGRMMNKLIADKMFAFLRENNTVAEGEVKAEKKAPAKPKAAKKTAKVEESEKSE